MIKILFICHGNICRSPMAEFVMKDMVWKAGLENEIWISSADTSTEELDKPVYSPVRRPLKEWEIDCAGKTARRMIPGDYGAYDLLIGMDEANLRNMRWLCGGYPEGKIHRLLEYAGRQGEVVDPWYTRDFETTWRDMNDGCRWLFDELTAGRFENNRSTTLWDNAAYLSHRGNPGTVTVPGFSFLFNDFGRFEGCLAGVVDGGRLGQSGGDLS